jgi:hypothetical protein
MKLKVVKTVKVLHLSLFIFLRLWPVLGLVNKCMQ